MNNGPGTVGSGLPTPTAPGQVLTLPAVVARVLGNNSGLLLARQRLQRAQESINQVNAQIKPQFRANANDVYNSYPAFPEALPAPVISNPTLPDGGVIPAVTDAANNFSTAYIGGNGLNVGGGGNVAPGFVSGTTGANTSSTGGGTATPSAGTTGGGAASTSTGTAAPSTTGNGTAAPNGSTGVEGPSNTGAGNAGTGSTGGGTSAPSTGTASPASGNGTAAPTVGGTGVSPATGAAGASNAGNAAGGGTGAAAGATSPATGTGTTGTGTTGAGNAGGANATPGNAGGTTGTGTNGTGTGTTGTGTDGNTGAGSNGAGAGTTNGNGTTGTGSAGTGNTGTGGAGAPAAGADTAPPGTYLPTTPDDEKKKKQPAPPTPPSPATTGASTGATGMALFVIPAIIQDYVTDTQSLLQPPTSGALPLKVKIADAQSQQAAESLSSGKMPEADPRQTTTTGDASPTGATAVQGLRNTYNVDANATQFLDVFGLVPTARDTENDVRDFYALDVTRLLNETALAVKNLFFNVLYAGALVATQQEQVDYAAENVRITQSRLRNGIVSRYDVLTAQAALATAQQQLTAAQDQYQLAQAELSYILGTDPDQPQTLQAPALPPLDLGVDLPQDIQIAERQRPELGQAGRNIDNAQRQVKLAASSLYPVLGLVGEGNYTSNGSEVTPRSYATISAQVAVPLDDGGLTRSRVRSAQVQVQTEAVTQGQLQSSVSLEVRQAAINIRNAQAEVGSSEYSVTQSLEAVRLAQERYGAGLGTFLDVLNALALLANARTNYANAQYFYQSSLAQLVRAIGGR